MHVAIISDTFIPQINGVTKTMTRLKENFDKRSDVEYRFFVPDYQMKESLSSTIAFKSLRLFLYPEYKVALPNYPLFKKQLDAFQPDILHIKTQGTMGLMGLRYAETKGTPVISTYTTNLSAYLESYNLQILEKPLWAYLKNFHNKCAVNLVPSRYSKLQLEEKNIENLQIWKRCVDLEAFSPKYRSETLRASLKTKKDEVLLLYVGRIASEKNLDLLMDTVKKLNETEQAFQLIMVGDGPYREALEEQAIPNVNFVGYKTGEALAEYYASCDIFVFPSTSETFGNVILEAMASKTVVLSVNEGGVQENIISPYNSIAVDEVTPEDFYENIVALIESPDSRRFLAENAYTYAKKKGWKNLFDALVSTYEDVIEASKEMIERVS
jgi:glycosyltransferase involved in cell wall biosynthesis